MEFMESEALLAVLTDIAFGDASPEFRERAFQIIADSQEEALASFGG